MNSEEVGRGKRNHFTKRKVCDIIKYRKAVIVIKILFIISSSSRRKPCELVYHHAPRRVYHQPQSGCMKTRPQAFIYCRLDDIQFLAELVIYTASP